MNHVHHFVATSLPITKTTKNNHTHFVQAECPRKTCSAHRPSTFPISCDRGQTTQIIMRMQAKLYGAVKGPSLAGPTGFCGGDLTVVVAISIQQRMCMSQIEVLELQHRIWPPGHHSSNELVHYLHGFRVGVGGTDSKKYFYPPLAASFGRLG
jgi:hypothetical protein